MDKLLKIGNDHKIISEMLTVYKELLENVNMIDPLSYAGSLDKIFQETVLPHFESEEKDIFPFFLSKNPTIANDIVILQAEHERMKREMARINAIVEELKAHDDAKVKEKLVSLCTELSEELSEHALKEDTTVFSLF
jgi:hemerythrin-like domain-containing protein